MCSPSAVIHEKVEVSANCEVTEKLIIEAKRWVLNVIWHPDIRAFHVSNQLFDSQNVSMKRFTSSRVTVFGILSMYHF